jgi:hypothetical protein
MEKLIALNISMYLHLFCEIITCAYIFIFSKKYDIIFVSYIFIIVILKLIFKYECIWSVFDKQIIDPTYVLGSDPKNYPFRKLYGDNHDYLLNIIGFLLLSELIYIFIRNKGNDSIRVLCLLNIAIIFYIEDKLKIF